MQPQVELRPPVSEDGKPVFDLVKQCPPLDTNSMYCNLLQCSHFANTSVAATLEGELVGFISAYIIPEKPDTVFVWQVAVGEKARGQGLAKKMLNHIVERPACANVKYLETTITESNEASWALFSSFARDKATELQRSVMFDKETHFGGSHDTELLARIGPF